jgi:hypothetical protein
MNDLSPELNLRKTDIHVQLFNLFAEEELLWYQRSHEKWLLEGDLNTSYFHRVANGRKRKNTMFSLKENDILIEGTDNLISHTTAYYKNLFGPAPGNILDFDASMWKPHEKLSEEENSILTRPFSMEEVKFALFSMAPNKAPGPDNIPIEFYQHCWDIIK